MCLPVFHHPSSEIAPAVPGAREAPGSALVRMSASLPRDDPTRPRGQDEISICAEAEIRGSNRDGRKPKEREGIKGSSVCRVFMGGQVQVSGLGGLSRGWKGKCPTGSECV